jgi:acetyltransferase-like isoleucine patch superfamily enzyme
MDTPDIFARLRNGETIPAADPQAYKMREASLVTKRLLLQMNRSSDPEETRRLLSLITASDIDKSTVVFTPLYINYGKHTKIGKNVFIHFDCIFLDLGGITIEDHVLIAPRVSLLSEGHPLSRKDRQALVPGRIHLKRTRGSGRAPRCWQA